MLALIWGAVQLHGYWRLIDERLAAGPYQSNTLVFAAPQPVFVGAELTPAQLTGALDRAGYRRQAGSSLGWYQAAGTTVTVHTGRDSYFGQGAGGRIEFSGNKVARVQSLAGQAGDRYLLEPELIGNLANGEERQKRRPVRYADIPESLRNAVIATEDKRFWNHGGLDYLRLGKVVYKDLREGRKAEGGSTITMQLARGFFLDQEKTFKRKLNEIVIASLLEWRLNKEQILEHYLNQVFLGAANSYAIHGMGQAARTYFSKDITQLNLPESAMLAGIIQRPSYFNPYRHVERTTERRNLVLRLMRENNFITEPQYQAAAAAPLGVKKATIDPGDAPYFLELVTTTLDKQMGDTDFARETHHIHTSLDLALQRAANQAIANIMPRIDKSVARVKHDAKPQVVVIALDARTGEVKAAMGGRSYAESQFNRIFSKRQPGSTFKPFVYAAALSSALDTTGKRITPATMVDDVQTTWKVNGQEYQPANFDKRFHGRVSLRQALTHSYNIATIKVAELAGFERVANLVHQAGLNAAVLPTPAMALGSYDVTPLELAGAFTTFANSGTAVEPRWVNSIRDRTGRVVFRDDIDQRQVLDPRVNYQVVSMLQDVIDKGTAASARSMGFKDPAAGKTGTARDGWFVGFTGKLLCLVWVGFDDYTDLKLEGSKSALLVWTEFMKAAGQLPQYSNPPAFEPPPGLVKVSLTSSGYRAGAGCGGRPEWFIKGTEPAVQDCYDEDPQLPLPEQIGNSRDRSLFGRDFGVLN